jgi:hypothetical protein
MLENFAAQSLGNGVTSEGSFGLQTESHVCPVDNSGVFSNLVDGSLSLVGVDILIIKIR